MKSTTRSLRLSALPAILAGAAALFCSLPAAAVTIDTFTTAQAAVTDPPGTSPTVVTGGADIIGTRRALNADLFAGGGAGPVSTSVAAGVLSLTITNTTPDSRGEAIVTWDGDATAGNLNYTGLAGQNLTAGSSNTLRIRVNTASAGVNIVVDVYTSQTASSRAFLRIPTAVASATDFFLTYKYDFVQTAAAPADFTNVGAIVMRVRGTEASAAIDLVDTTGPSISTATKRDLDLANSPIAAPVLEGSTFKYRIQAGSTNGLAEGVDLSDTVDANTALDAASVRATPIAIDDAYVTAGNVGISRSAPGILGNDFDPDANGSPPELQVSAASVGVFATTLGGTLSIGADGAFDYQPPTGTGRAVDTFTYTLQDNDAQTTTGLIKIAIGPRVWFVDDAHPGTNSGTRDNPFVGFTATNVNGASGAGDVDAAGDVIFMFAGSHNAQIELEADEWLIGEGEGLTIDGQAIVAAGSDPVLTSAAHGIVLAAGNTLRGFTVGATGASSFDISGSAFGTLTVSNVVLNGAGGGVSLTTGALDATFESIASTSGTHGINLDTVSGSFTVSGATTLSDSSFGVRINASPTLAATFGNTVALTATAGTALFASNGGTLNFTGISNVATATNGPAVNLASTSLGSGATFATVSSTTNATGGLILDTVTGGFTATGGAISVTAGSGNAVDINAGSSVITYAGTVSAASTGRLADITSRTGGTVTLSGNLSGSANTGINVASNTGGTIVFSGSSKAINTGANAGVTLSSNGGATINFTNGGLVISSTSGTGFGASGGAAAITVQGSGNTIASTSGTALNVTSSTIGSAGLTFQSIASNGAVSGIILNATGSTGGLTVTGTGSAGSGGTIQSSTSHGIQLTSASSTSLSRMIVQSSGDDGIFGTNLTGFTLADSSVINNGNAAADDGIYIVDPAGTITLTNVTATGNAHNNAWLYDSNNTGGNSALAVSGGSYSSTANANGNHGMLVDILGTATLGASTISGATFSNNKVIGLQVLTGDSSTMSDFTISSNTFSDTGTGNSQEISMDVSKAGTSNMTVKVLGNNIQGHNSHGMNFFTAAGGGTTGTYNARIENNTIGTAATAGSGSLIGNCMRVNINGDADASVLINNNVLRQCPNGRGIEVIGRNGTGGLDVTVTNNDVNTNDVSGFPLCAILVQSNDVTIPNTVRSDVRGNTVLAGTAFDVVTTFIGVVETGTSTSQLVDTAPASASCTAQLTSTNTGSASANAGCSLIAGPITTPP